MRRSCSVPTAAESAEGKTVGNALPEVPKGPCPGSDPGRQASAMYFDLRAFEKRSGGNDAPVREHVPDSGRRFALFQYLWDATVALEPLYGSGGDLCFAANEPKIASYLRRRPANAGFRKRSRYCASEPAGHGKLRGRRTSGQYRLRAAGHDIRGGG